MDLENLQRAAEIKEKIDRLQKASDKLEDKNARIWVSHSNRFDEIWDVCLWEDDFLKDLRHLIDEHISALTEEAKTL
ncbi:MAG: hypothetical protein IK113_04290 [Bacteroidales bacterium]|nr:hypothetical protein [Bacteroidales bacterium]